MGVKDWILFNSNWVVAVGFASLALAISGAIMLVSDFLFDSAVAAIATAAIAIALAWLWFVSPLLARARVGGAG